MNQPARLNWTTTFSVDEFAGESGASKDLGDVRGERELIADLTKLWSQRKVNERANVGLPELKNKLTGENYNTEAVRAEASASLESPRIRLEPLRRLQATFSPLQEWEGYVVEVTNSHVIANLVDLTGNATRAAEQAIIPLEEFSDIDLQKLAAGKVFRWAIGYQRLPTGTKMRVSQIIFRELPQWTTRELRDAKKEAAELFEFFNPNE